MTATDKLRVAIRYWTGPKSSYHDCTPTAGVAWLEHRPHSGPESWSIGVYEAYDRDGSPLYVGRSKHFGRRLREHRKTSRWWPNVSHVEVTLTPCQLQAIYGERYAIHRLQPTFNRAGRP